eukprot:scaffold286743_cov18-Tisochrysis_lutea.AAC.1
MRFVPALSFVALRCRPARGTAANLDMQQLDDEHTGMTPVRGALTKRLQQASPHHSATSTLAAMGAEEGQQQLQQGSKPMRPWSQDVLTVLQG